MLTSDAKISMCVNGRDMRQIRGTRQNRSTQDTARFPHLLDSQITAIIDAGLDKANENYSKKYYYRMLNEIYKSIPQLILHKLLK